MHEKSKTFDKFKEFYTMVKNVFHTFISYFQSDGVGEYVNKKFSSFFKKNSIVHHFLVLTRLLKMVGPSANIDTL